MTYKSATVNPTFLGALYTQHFLTIDLYHTFPSFAVPCFVMISGAFLLANDKNASYRFFYRKALCNLGIQAIVFSGLYFIYYVVTAAPAILIWNQDLTRLFTPFRDFLQGRPAYHLWYLYTMLGVYLTVPVWVRLRQEISEKAFTRFAWILFVVASLSGMTSSFQVNWSIGKSACYLGYFLLGYALRKNAGKGDNRQGSALIACGVFVQMLLSVVWSRSPQPTTAALEFLLNYNSNFSPRIILSSVLIFAGFAKIKIRQNILVERLAKESFYIYLFHVFVWSIMKKGVEVIWGVSADCRIVIPVCIVLVFIISYGLSLLYRKIWAFADKDGRITNRLCALVGLA